MREIKFRAWNNKTKEMSFDESMGDILCEKEYDKPHLILMQFTGLKDKNGEEIYEGDILSSLYKRDGCKGVYEIAWNGMGFTPLRKGKHQQIYVTISSSDLSRCEVIGNIYENPELLNVDKKSKGDQDGK